MIRRRPPPVHDAPNPLDRFPRSRDLGARCWAADITRNVRNPVTGEAMPLDIWAARLGISPAAMHDRLCAAPAAVALHARPRQRKAAARHELEELLR